MIYPRTRDMISYTRHAVPLFLAALAALASVANPCSRERTTAAAAKPELAPYGHAAVEALERLGIWARVQPKMVYAGNIGMAKQYGTSGNADAVFSAYSLVQRERGKVIRVDAKLHAPIAQSLGIL